MGSITYNLTGITVLDGIFTLIIKGLLAWMLIIAVVKAVKLYGEGNYPQLVMSVGIGLVLIAFIIGINNVVDLGKGFIDLFRSTGGGGGGGGPAV